MADIYSGDTSHHGEQRSPNSPLVSIVTPVLNGTKYLEECIQSVLKQSYPHIEHIFVDGGSTDGTLERLASYQSKYPDRIRFVTGRDKGIGEAVSKGLKIARGEILGWIDSDDIYEPDAIQTVVEFFRTNRDAYFVFGGCNMIGETGEKIRQFPIRDFDLPKAIHDSYCLVFCAAFYKRAVFEKVGPFNTLGNDLDYWLRTAKVFQLHRIEKVLANWRWHQDSISGSKAAKNARIRKMRLKEDYALGRQYGASIFSPRSQRYFRFLILDGLHLYPIVNKLYPPVERCFRAIRKLWGQG